MPEDWKGILIGAGIGAGLGVIRPGGKLERLLDNPYGASFASNVLGQHLSIRRDSNNHFSYLSLGGSLLATEVALYKTKDISVNVFKEMIKTLWSSPINAVAGNVGKSKKW